MNKCLSVDKSTLREIMQYITPTTLAVIATDIVEAFDKGVDLPRLAILTVAIDEGCANIGEPAFARLLNQEYERRQPAPTQPV